MWVDGINTGMVDFSSPRFKMDFYEFIIEKSRERLDCYNNNDDNDNNYNQDHVLLT